MPNKKKATKKSGPKIVSPKRVAKERRLAKHEKMWSDLPKEERLSISGKPSARARANAAVRKKTGVHASHMGVNMPKGKGALNREVAERLRKKRSKKK